MSYETISMRSLIGKCLVEEAKENNGIYVLDADLAHSTTTDVFEKEYPDRFIETGIAEQNALSIASGIAYAGKIPFFVDFAMFVAGTTFTQIRMACYANINLKLIASHPGMDGGFDGASHHANEDLALMRALPNMKVLIPSNPDELKEAIHTAILTPGPVYIRCARDNVPNLSMVSKPEIGKATVVSDCGNDFALIYEGSATLQAMEAFEDAKGKGLRGKLVNIYSLKPLDKQTIISLGQEVKGIVTVENHSVIGGLGSSVSEVLALDRNHAKLRMVGVGDVFTESGKSLELKNKYGLNSTNIIDKIIESIR